MTKEQVQMLRDAGISEAAIIDRLLGTSAAEPQPEPEPVEVPQPDPTPAPVLPDPKPANPGPTPGEDAILKAIEKLTGTIQARNVQSLGSENNGQESVEDILTNMFYK